MESPYAYLGNPPTLGDLARRTGFDLESLLFSFAIGGIVFSAYHVIFGEAPSESLAHERGHPRHRYHTLAILFAPVGFVVLSALTTLNPIYAAAIALVGGFFATLYCRPDLWRKMLASGVLFLLLYFVVFALLNLTFPGYVAAVWNLTAVSGGSSCGVCPSRSSCAPSPSGSTGRACTSTSPGAGPARSAGSRTGAVRRGPAREGRGEDP